MQLEAAFNAIDLVHRDTPDIKIDIGQLDNSITGVRRRQVTFENIKAAWRYDRYDTASP
jgi:hypothetical protein